MGDHLPFDVGWYGVSSNHFGQVTDITSSSFNARGDHCWSSLVMAKSGDAHTEGNPTLDLE